MKLCRKQQHPLLGQLGILQPASRGHALGVACLMQHQAALDQLQQLCSCSRSVIVQSKCLAAVPYPVTSQVSCQDTVPAEARHSEIL